MGSPDDGTVTIDRDYFETLMRRAKCNGEVKEGATATDDTVNVSRSEYDTLVAIAHRYSNLTAALIRGGIDEQTISVLSENESTVPPLQEETPRIPATSTPSQTTDGGVRLSVADHSNRGTDSSYRGYQNVHGNVHQSRFPGAFPTRSDANEWTESACYEGYSADCQVPGFGISPAVPGAATAVQTENQMADGRQLVRVSTRTVLLYNLPEGITLADITDVVRGGPILDIFLRNDRSVAISFVFSQDARAFYDRVRKHDLYLKNKRAEVKWNDRQFFLQGHISSKIRSGATRNLVIRRCSNSHTEESIRDDLEHIHNLVVIKVDFVGGDCLIKLNSVHNATYARTCMMSRLKYKGAKIEWDVDECAQAIEPVAPRQYREVSAPKPVGRQISNRFEALFLDDGEEAEQDQSAPGIPARSSVKVAV